MTDGRTALVHSADLALRSDRWADGLGVHSADLALPSDRWAHDGLGALRGLGTANRLANLGGSRELKSPFF